VYELCDIPHFICVRCLIEANAMSHAVRNVTQTIKHVCGVSHIGTDPPQAEMVRLVELGKNTTATHCSTLKPSATHCSTLKPFVTLCTTCEPCQEHTATHCNTLQHSTTHAGCVKTSVLIARRAMPRGVALSPCALVHWSAPRACDCCSLSPFLSLSHPPLPPFALVSR